MKKPIILIMLVALASGCDKKPENPAQAAQPVVHEEVNLTPEAAKAQAAAMLDTLNKIEHVASMDLSVPAVRMKEFDAPLMNEVGRWPDQYLPANVAIQPYQICLEAAQALDNMAAARNRTRDSMAPDVNKWREEYQDKKTRCEKTLN